MATVSRENMGEATGLTNLLRNLGGSVGISAITTMVARGTQTHQALMVGQLSPYNPVFNEHIAKVQTALTPQVGSVGAHDQAYGLTYQTLLQQAALGSYVDQFRLLVIVCLLCVPLVFLFKKPVRRPGADRSCRRTLTESEFRSCRSSGASRICGAWRGFSQGDAGPGFSDKDLARVFCNSWNS